MVAVSPLTTQKSAPVSLSHPAASLQWIQRDYQIRNEEEKKTTQEKPLKIP